MPEADSTSSDWCLVSTGSGYRGPVSLVLGLRNINNAAQENYLTEQHRLPFKFRMWWVTENFFLYLTVLYSVQRAYGSTFLLSNVAGLRDSIACTWAYVSRLYNTLVTIQWLRLHLAWVGMGRQWQRITGRGIAFPSRIRVEQPLGIKVHALYNHPYITLLRLRPFFHDFSLVLLTLLSTVRLSNYWGTLDINPSLKVFSLCPPLFIKSGPAYIYLHVLSGGTRYLMECRRYVDASDYSMQET